MRLGGPGSPSLELIARSLVQVAPVDINPLGIPLSEERQGFRDVVYLSCGVRVLPTLSGRRAIDATFAADGRVRFESGNTSAKLPTQNIDLP